MVKIIMSMYMCAYTYVNIYCTHVCIHRPVSTLLNIEPKFY